MGKPIGLVLLWVLGAGTAVGMVPLFAGPTYEFSLAAGLLFPGPVALAVFWQALVNSKDHSPTSSLHLLRRGFEWSFAVSLLCLTVALANGVFAGLCDPASDMPLFLLGPIGGLLLAGVVGSVSAATLIRVTVGRGLAMQRWHRITGSAVCLVVPLLTAAFSGYRFYTSPMVFAFDPFLGFFSGTLYDTLVQGTDRLLTYRVATVGWFLTAYGWCGLLDASREKAGYWLALARGVGPLSIGLTLGLVIAANGTKLGHYQTEESIRSSLGGQLKHGRCEVVFSESIPPSDAEILARDCEGHLAQLAEFFAIPQHPSVTVFLFANSSEKARLMGARNVYIAKPWRNEVYIQKEQHPHRVLGHELAHVVAGHFGAGPFKIAGSFAGWLPDPGRIEGLAVAAAPRERDPMTLAEWSKAMLELRRLPPLKAIFTLGFFGYNSSSAYTVAGAFMQWLKSEYSTSTLRAWYQGASLKELTGLSLEELDAKFREHIRATDLEPWALERARIRFERPALFQRQCPHQVDKYVSEGHSALGRARPGLALTAYEQALRLSPKEYAAITGAALAQVRAGNLDAAEQVLLPLVNDTTQPVERRVRAQELSADIHVRKKQYQRARKLYQQAQQQTTTAATARRLAIKALMCQAAPQLRDSIEALLLGNPQRGVDWGEAALRLGQSAALDSSGVSDYLVGRNLRFRGRYRLALQRLTGALQDKRLPPLVRRQALFDALDAACSLEATDDARHLFQQLNQDPKLPKAQRLGLLRFAQRCAISSSL